MQAALSHMPNCSTYAQHLLAAGPAGKLQHPSGKPSRIGISKVQLVDCIFMAYCSLVHLCCIDLLA